MRNTTGCPLCELRDREHRRRDPVGMAIILASVVGVAGFAAGWLWPRVTAFVLLGLCSVALLLVVTDA